MLSSNMNKASFIHKIFTKKTQDYTFSIAFFAIFSIFIFFAIRPSLTTAFSLKKEEEELKIINAQYDKQVENILATQSFLEKNRDSLYLLEEGIPSTPQINKVIDDIKKISDAYSLSLKKAGMGEVNLSHPPSDRKLQTLKLTIEGASNFENVMKFVESLFQQRRLKSIQKMVISKEMIGTESAQLKINLELQGYYQ